MVSSGAISPARAPASIDMLQTVMRPAIDRPRTTSPAYSITWPVPPAVPIWPMIGEDHVLGGDAERQRALDADPHVQRPLLQQRLGRQHVLDLGGADAEGERAERAVRRGVAVAADDRHAGQREALLGADDVDDALADVVDVEQLDAEVAAVLLQRLDLDPRLLLGDALRAVGGRHVVVGHRERRVRPAHRPAGLAQALEGLRAGHLVHQMAVDVEQAGAVLLPLDQVGVPDLVEQRSALGP